MHFLKRLLGFIIAVQGHSILFAQALELLPYSAYQKVIKGTYANEENVSDDNGGYLILQFRNNSASAFSLADLQCQKNTGTSTYAPLGYYLYPESIAPGGLGALMIKGNGSPFRENDSILVSVNGQTFRLKNETPGLKIANLIPQASLDTLLMFLRNDLAEPVTLREVCLNGVHYVLSDHPGLISTGDSLIPPKGIAIVRIPSEVPLQNCLPLYAGASYQASSSASTAYTGAFVRNVEPDFSFGTWWSSVFDPGNEEKQKALRELHIGMLQGPGNYVQMQKGYDDYFIKSIYSSNFSDPVDTASAGSIIRNVQDVNYIRTWMIDDEPDLHDKSIPEQVLKNQTYWNNDPNTPSYVNLSSERKFNRYGFYSDIVSMDHYAAPPAPNIINLRWVPIVGSPGNINEALQYTEVLKANTEPRRMWTWVQFVTGSYTQDTFAFNAQFWMHIFGGAKSLEFFVAQGETKSDEPAMWREGQKVVDQQASIRNLCLYGEPYSNISSNNSKVIARSLVGEKYMLIGAMNNSITYAWNGSFAPIRYNASINKNLSYELTFELPAWIAPQAYQLGEKGRRIPISLQSAGGQTYKLIPPQNLGTATQIFVIGEADQQAPTAPKGLHLTNQIDSANYTLSWDFATDNVGVRAYIVERDGQVADTVYAPFYDVRQAFSPCDHITWTVKALDNYGNPGPAQTIEVPLNHASPEIAIAGQSADTTIEETDSLQLFVNALNVARYQWQSSTDQANWTDLPDSSAAVLVLPSNSTAYYRCILSGYCGAFDTSGIITVSRSLSTGIRETKNIVGQLFPNPAHTSVSMVQNRTAAEIRLLCRDVFGNVILEKNDQHGPKLYLDLSGLSSGVYYLQIMADGEVQTLPIVKQ